MDGPYAAVKFPPKESGLQGAIGREVGNNEEATLLLQDVRLLRKDELQVYIHGSCTCGKMVNSKH